MIERAVREGAAAWLAEGRAAVVVEVLGARGSVPRGHGTRMAVSLGTTLGTIGGGHLELKAIDTARAMLARGETAPREQRFALGPALGQCCGGAVALGFAPLDALALQRWPVPEPLFHLQLHGAGHVGRAIATLLATLDVAVDWFDARDDEFPPTTALGSPWPAHIRRGSLETIERAVGGAKPGACFLVLTHEHALDLRIVEAILRRADFAFCGLIGSGTKRASFARRLEARGLAADTIARMTCPIGLPGIAGKAPEVIAAGVVAQLLQLRSATSTMPAHARLPPVPDAAAAGRG